MNKYGSDKPDTRFELTLQDISRNLKNSEFNVFKDTLKNKGSIKILIVKDKADKFSRAKINNLEEIAKLYKTQGLYFTKIENNKFSGGIAKFFKNRRTAINKNLFSRK